MSATIQVYWTQVEQPFSDGHFTALLGKLPANMQARMLGYVRWQDRHLGLLGKLLLMKGLAAYGLDAKVLERLEYNPQQKPFLPDGPHFNIAHSGQVVVCALSARQELGIDVEQQRPQSLSDFRRVFSADEWNDIQLASDPQARFFHYWTLKESVIKADGRGMSAPLLDIHISGLQASLSGQQWHLRPLELMPGYSAHLTTNTSKFNVEVQQVPLPS